MDYYFRKSNEVNILLKILFVINNMSKLAKKISRLTPLPAFLLNVFSLPFSKSFLNRTVGTTLINIRLNAADFHYRSELPAFASDHVAVSGMKSYPFAVCMGGGTLRTNMSHTVTKFQFGILEMRSGLRRV